MTASIAVERRARWECRDCGVVARHESGDPVPRPGGWTDTDRCIRCERDRLMAIKQDGSGDAGDLIRFELLRGKPIYLVARTAGVTQARVRGLRRAMVVRGELEAPRSGKRGSAGRSDKWHQAQRQRREREYAEKVARATDALRRDPHRSDQEVAAECGVQAPLVREVRKEIGAPPPPGSAAATREAALSFLRDRTDGATTSDVGRAFGVSRACAGHWLRHLVADGDATVDNPDAEGVAKVYRAVAETA